MKTRGFIDKLHTEKPQLCLDYLHYARRLFGAGEANWYRSSQLLNLMRQGQQGVRADVILFSVLDWMIAYCQASASLPQAGGNSVKVLRAACGDAPLVAALNDAIQALGTLSGPRASFALLIDDPANWLSWAGAEETTRNSVDEGDAEDVAVYLSSLLHQLKLDTVCALFLQQIVPLDGDAAQAYEPLTNTAQHYGIASVLCSTILDQAAQGFDCLATCAQHAASGRMLTEQDWMRPQGQPPGVSFVVGAIPGSVTPEQVLEALACWRGQ